MLQHGCEGTGVRRDRLVAARYVGQHLQEFDVRVLGGEGKDKIHFVFTPHGRDDATGVSSIGYFAFANECHKWGQSTPVRGNTEGKCHAGRLAPKHVLAVLQCGQP